MKRRTFLRSAVGGLLAAALPVAAPAKNFRWHRAVTKKLCVDVYLTDEMILDPAGWGEAWVKRKTQEEFEFSLKERFAKVWTVECLGRRESRTVAFGSDSHLVRTTWRITGILTDKYAAMEPTLRPYTHAPSDQLGIPLATPFGLWKMQRRPKLPMLPSGSISQGSNISGGRRLA